MSSLTIDSKDAKVDGRHAWVRVRVPSHGHPAFYPDGSFPEGWVQIRRMTVQEEATIQSNGLDPVDRINTVIRNCLRTPQALQASQLLATDRIGILLYQRVYSYGAKYTFASRCTQCKVETRSQVDLERDLRYHSPDDVEASMMESNVADFKHEDPFTVMLPDAGTSIQVKFLRSEDEGEVLRKIKARRSMQRNEVTDPTHVITMMRQIVSIESIPEWAAGMHDGKKEVWLRQMSGGDAATIRESIEARETGVDTTVEVGCTNCGARRRVSLPFDIDFFLPSTR